MLFSDYEPRYDGLIAEAGDYEYQEDDDLDEVQLSIQHVMLCFGCYRIRQCKGAE